MALSKTVGGAADQIIRELGYNSIDRNIDRRNVILRMDYERSQMFGILAHGGALNTQDFQVSVKVTPKEMPDVFYTTKIVDVLWDNTYQRFYSNMPTEYVSFFNNTGIRLIKPIQDTATSAYFISQRAGASLLYASLESANLGGMVGFEVEGQKVWYNNMLPDTYKKVSITYIPALTGLEETDLMPMTAEFYALLMDKVREAFGLVRQVKDDKTIDSVSN